MNSLTELRQVFTGLGKEVKDFSGYQFTSDGMVWGVLDENPVADGHMMTPLEWKNYLKVLKKAHSSGETLNIKPDYTPTPVQAIIKATVQEPSNKAIVRKQAAPITCPHCGVEGGVIGMKRWHFDKCKSKK